MDQSGDGKLSEDEFIKVLTFYLNLNVNTETD